MDLALFAFAFGAGALATVNPCGFVMLPALVAVQLRHVGASSEPGTSGRSRAALVVRGLRFGLAATLGFVVVFGLLGAAVAIGARSLGQFFPYGGFTVGVALLALGGWGLATGRAIPLPASLRSAYGTGGLPFGVAYAVASLSCTLPIFMAVVGGTMLASGVVGALLPLLGYAIGMGSVLLAVSLATALSATAVVQTLRRAMPFVERIGSLLLVIIGAYLVLYWLPAALGTR